MSELILKDKDKSLQNTILKDGQFVFGEITNNSSITSSGLGSFASGRVDVSSSINVTLPGSHAFGTVSNNSSISNHARGTLLFGRVDTSSNISADSVSGGCITFGHAYDKSSIRTISPGAYAGGNAITNGVILSAGNGAFAHGYVSNSSIHAKGGGSHAEGSAYSGSQIAADDGAHAEGFANHYGYILAEGDGAHAEGFANSGTILAKGNGAHAEGYNTTAIGNSAHAEGYNTTAIGDGAHAEGIGGVGKLGSAEGFVANTNNKAIYIHNIVQNAFLQTVKKIKIENEYYYVTNIDFRTESPQVYVDHKISNDSSYSDVYYVCGAYGDGAYVSGECNIACMDNQTVIGKFNNPDSSALFIVGNGQDNLNRHNALTISQDNFIYTEDELISAPILKITGCPDVNSDNDWISRNQWLPWSKYSDLDPDSSIYKLECDDYVWYRWTTDQATCVIKKYFKNIEIKQIQPVSGDANIMFEKGIFRGFCPIYIINTGSQSVHIHFEGSGGDHPSLASGHVTFGIRHDIFGDGYALTAYKTVYKREIDKINVQISSTRRLAFN